MTVQFPFWVMSLFIFGAMLNLCIAIMMLYLRSKGGTETYTKSQLWALTLLAWLFFVNFGITTLDVFRKQMANDGLLSQSVPQTSLWLDLILLSGYLLLAFGLVYPRPFTKWQKLKPLLIGLMGMLLGLMWVDIMNEHSLAFISPYLDAINLLFIPAVFIPVFIWLSEYSRQPSKEGRMIYTILIWGFLFVIFSGQGRNAVISVLRNNIFGAPIGVYVTLIVLAIVRLGIALWGQRKTWSTAEWLHVGMLLSSSGIALVTAVAGKLGDPDYWSETGDIGNALVFLSTTFGWMILRPLLFSYGLLRYRLMGDQVKAEHAIAFIGAFLSSTAVCLAIINLATGQDDPTVIGGAAALSVLLLYPFWKFFQNQATKLLPMALGAEGVSMRERRNTYLMGLQTATVRGVIEDPDDKDALEQMRKALGVTPREHELLMESIMLHEARMAPKREIEDAFLMSTDGRLITHYSPVMEKAALDGLTTGTDSDIVAGMFSAITEYVGEAMKREEGEKGSMGAISYGGSNLAIERDGTLVLALVVLGPDDLELRQTMRDVLGDINDRFGKRIGSHWDGSRDGLEETEGIIKGLVLRLTPSRA